MVWLAVGLVMAAGCDVTNPGPIDDVDLNDPQSHQGLVRGSGRMLLSGVNEIIYTGAIVSRELIAGGQTGNYGHDPRIQGGALPFDSEVDRHWNALHKARFIAEDAIRRFDEVGSVEPQILAEAHLWAGFANQVLGANMCQAVFDGGPAEPFTRHLEKAESHFATAIQTAAAGSDLRLAATAGRAQVRALQGDWAGVLSDAASIPDDFVFLIVPDGIEIIGDTKTNNEIYWAGSANPYSAYSVWQTFFDQYYLQTGDPRTPWAENPDVPVANASLSGYGQVPFKFQTKYTSNTDPYRLVSGAEMRLLEAEALLEQGSWQQAMEVINEVRTRNVSETTGAPLEPWMASSLNEAWTFLKRERSIELWLEGRRFSDLRRWEDAGTPGELDWPDFESISPLFSQEERARCFPIPEVERNTNPNIP